MQARTKTRWRRSSGSLAAADCWLRRARPSFSTHFSLIPSGRGPASCTGTLCVGSASGKSRPTRGPAQPLARQSAAQQRRKARVPPVGCRVRDEDLGAGAVQVCGHGRAGRPLGGGTATWSPTGRMSASLCTNSSCPRQRIARAPFERPASGNPATRREKVNRSCSGCCPTNPNTWRPSRDLRWNRSCGTSLKACHTFSPR